MKKLHPPILTDAGKQIFPSLALLLRWNSSAFQERKQLSVLLVFVTFQRRAVIFFATPTLSFLWLPVQALSTPFAHPLPRPVLLGYN